MVSVGERCGLLRQPEFQLEELEDDSGNIRVTRTSTFTGKRNTMVLPIDVEMFRVWRSGGGLIQNVFPHLSADQREFLMSGATPDEWAGIFGGEDD